METDNIINWIFINWYFTLPCFVILAYWLYVQLKKEKEMEIINKGG